MANQKAQLVRYQHGKNKFEILTKPGSVLKFREGKLGWDKVHMADVVFSNSSRGDLASGKDLEAAFGTSNPEECCKKIVETGELQLSAQERKDEMEAKKKRSHSTHFQKLHGSQNKVTSSSRTCRSMYERMSYKN